MTRKIRRKRRRRKRRKGVIKRPSKEDLQLAKAGKLNLRNAKQADSSANAKQEHARAALVARLPGGAFREFLAQKFPGYSSLENTLVDDYVRTIGKWEGWLFFYLGLIYILKNFSSNPDNPVIKATTAPSGLIASSLI